MGMWDYPEEERLVGEHHAARVGHRVKPSRHLKVPKSFAHVAFAFLTNGAMARSGILGAVQLDGLGRWVGPPERTARHCCCHH